MRQLRRMSGIRRPWLCSWRRMNQVLLRSWRGRLSTQLTGLQICCPRNGRKEAAGLCGSWHMRGRTAQRWCKRR